MSTAMFVVVLVAGILAVQLILWIPVLVWFRRRRRVIASRLNSELAAETMIRSPEPGSYQGATVAGYPIVTNDGIIALTRRRLVFQALTGKVIEVPLTDITGVREAAVFKASMKGGRQHLVIQTSSGEIAFFVGDNAAWIQSLTAVATRPLAPASTADSLGDARAHRSTIAILAVAFASIGLALALAAGISAAVVANSISGNRHAEGTVVDISHKGKSYVPVVEFVGPQGATVQFKGWLGSRPPAFRVGEKVPVRYDPDDPQDAMIDQYWQMWFVPTLLGIIGSPFLIVGAALGTATLRARRQVLPQRPG